ncbi:MAG: hypothetical protein AAFO01_00600 [Pseudomonadota bacterium]
MVTPGQTIRRCEDRRRRVIELGIGLLLLAIFLFEAYLLLPPGIPFITTFALIPFRLRLSNYATVAVIAYALYAFGFSLLESLALASIWMTLLIYLIFDMIYDLPLTA